MGKKSVGSSFDLGTTARAMALLEKMGVADSHLQRVIDNAGYRRKVAEAFLSELGIVLSISDTQFDPAKFIGDGWKIIEDEVDQRSSILKKINLAEMVFETCLEKGESRITGEEKLRRLKAKQDFVPFGAKVFLSLWQDYQKNKENSFLEELYRTQGKEYLDFFGTILLPPYGDRCVLYLCRYVSGEWYWYCHWLGHAWCDVRFSAGCASR